MARNDKIIDKAKRNIQNIASGISQNMDTIYRNTYMTSNRQSKDLQNLTDKINDNISKIVNKNIDTIGLPSITKLYSRISSTSKNSEENISKDLSNMFDNGMMTDDLYGMFMSNRYLRELDNEIDTVCRYMPKLAEALEVQKDCILSADHFSKDYLNLNYPRNGDDVIIFGKRSKDLKRRYELIKLVEDIYDDTSKYGECFIYRVPYSIAIGKLLSNKENNNLISPNRIYENSINNESNNINESFILSMDSKGMIIRNINTGDIPVTESATYSNIPDGKNVTQELREKSILNKNEKFNIGIEICRTNIIESAVLNTKNAMDKRSKLHESSMAAVYENTVLNETMEDRKDIQASGNIKFEKDKIDKRIIQANDGLVLNEPKPAIKVKAPGCVVEKLKRDQVVPIYIKNICIGYYYFELRTMDQADSFLGFKNVLGDPITNGKLNDSNGFNMVDDQRQDDTIKYVAAQLSKFIDKKFVNSNQDLAKEIYMILKYNDIFNNPSIDNIKVTFIPPEDMVHSYFKLDDNTHRGVSDLALGLIPAKIYSTLYITYAIGNLTRGQDKRVYYVKQTVDTNIAQTLLNTISQIKQGNFGIRQFQNINNILNITGKFNDFIIPTNASGESPIEFEVMPGQEMQPPTELMEKLEGMAINSTGIPIEIIETRNQVDYAMQLTMSSSKVLRFCYKRQELFESILTDLIAPIYTYEYNDKTSITVTLPPPMFINVTNTNQLIDNTKGFVNSIVEVELANEENDNLKNMYTYELFKQYIGTHLDISKHKDILDRCKLIVKGQSNESHAEDNDGGF